MKESKSGFVLIICFSLRRNTGGEKLRQVGETAFCSQGTGIYIVRDAVTVMILNNNAPTTSQDAAMSSPRGGNNPRLLERGPAVAAETTEFGWVG